MKIGPPILLLLAAVGMAAGGSSRLSIKVSPAQALAPAFVRIQATVHPDAENRALRVVAQSDDFYRATEIQIEGDRGPSVRVVEFPGLPSGLYHVDVFLLGSVGQRAAASALVRVASSPGQR